MFYEMNDNFSGRNSTPFLNPKKFNLRKGGNKMGEKLAIPFAHKQRKPLGLSQNENKHSNFHCVEHGKFKYLKVLNIIF